MYFYLYRTDFHKKIINIFIFIISIHWFHGVINLCIFNETPELCVVSPINKLRLVIYVLISSTFFKKKGTAEKSSFEKR